MYDIVCTHQASPCRQGDVYSMTIAHHWNSGEQTIPMRYGRAIEELIRRSSQGETPPHLAHAKSNLPFRTDGVRTAHIVYTLFTRRVTCQILRATKLTLTFYYIGSHQTRIARVLDRLGRPHMAVWLGLGPFRAHPGVWRPR